MPTAFGLVSITVLVAVLITDTVPLPVLATYSRPSAPSAMPGRLASYGDGVGDGVTVWC